LVTNYLHLSAGPKTHKKARTSGRRTGRLWLTDGITKPDALTVELSKSFLPITASTRHTNLRIPFPFCSSPHLGVFTLDTGPQIPMETGSGTEASRNAIRFAS